MTWVSLEEAKEQVAIEVDETLHDARLARLIAAAERWAEGFLNRSLGDLVESGESPPAVPEDVKSALLLHVEWEFDRDTQNGDMLLQRAHDLLWPYRAEVSV
jgi:hypothetical protein